MAKRTRVWGSNEPLDNAATAGLTSQDLRRKRFLIISIFAIVIGVGGYVGYDFWSISQKTHALLTAPGIISSRDTSDNEKANEGIDTSLVSIDDLLSYTVADDQPRFLTIETLRIKARIKPMGTNSDNSIQAPRNIYDAGWYTGSSKPGKKGVMFIDGHASGASRQGLFGYLDTLQIGDTVGVEKGNGEKLNYKVVRVAVVALNEIDMKSILSPVEDATSGLNLMTCTGKWTADGETMDHRVVVYTKQI